MSNNQGRGIKRKGALNNLSDIDVSGINRAPEHGLIRNKAVSIIEKKNHEHLMLKIREI